MSWECNAVNALLQLPRDHRDKVPIVHLGAALVRAVATDQKAFFVISRLFVEIYMHRRCSIRKGGWGVDGERLCQHVNEIKSDYVGQEINSPTTKY